jgi:hypothetical protein
MVEVDNPDPPSEIRTTFAKVHFVRFWLDQEGSDRAVV